MLMSRQQHEHAGHERSIENMFALLRDANMAPGNQTSLQIECSADALQVEKFRRVRRDAPAHSACWNSSP
jgi:hypothetical protein